jgi:hypothetical protein
MDMVVVFGDATDCSRLIYWGILTNVVAGDGETRYWVKSMRKNPGMGVTNASAVTALLADDNDA